MSELRLFHSIVLPNISGKSSCTSSWLFLRYLLIWICISFSLWNLRCRSSQGACPIRASWVLVLLMTATHSYLHISSRTITSQGEIVIKSFYLLYIYSSLLLRFCPRNLFRINISSFLLKMMILTNRFLLILKCRLFYLILIILSLSCKWWNFILVYGCFAWNFSSSFWSGFFFVFF